MLPSFSSCEPEHQAETRAGNPGIPFTPARHCGTALDGGNIETIHDQEHITGNHGALRQPLHRNDRASPKTSFTTAERQRLCTSNAAAAKTKQKQCPYSTLPDTNRMCLIGYVRTVGVCARGIVAYPPCLRPPWLLAFLHSRVPRHDTIRRHQQRVVLCYKTAEHQQYRKITKLHN